MHYRIRALAGTAALLFIAACAGVTPATQSPGLTQPVSTPTPATPTPGGGAPAPNTAFSGALETVAGIAGTLSFVISETGQIAELKLEGGLTNFDCGGGRTIVDSGSSTYFFPDPILIQSGRFSVTRPDLDWDGVFDSATSVHGNIRLSGGADCANRPPSVTWTATSG